MVRPVGDVQTGRHGARDSENRLDRRETNGSTKLVSTGYRLTELLGDRSETSSDQVDFTREIEEKGKSVMCDGEQRI